MMKYNSEQFEAHAVELLEPHTQAIYTGPDVKRVSLLASIKKPRDRDNMHLHPVPGDRHRVLIARLNNDEHVRRLSKQLIPYCYVLISCSYNKSGECMARWRQV